jgi:integrase
MQFVDQFGVTRKNVSTGQKVEQNAKRIANSVEADAERIRAGRPPLDPEVTGPYLSLYRTGRTWEEFVEEYERRYLDGLAPGSRKLARECLDRFRRLMKPKAVNAITADMLADYVVALRRQPGRNQGETASPATVNKNLRHLKAALGLAKEWGYLHAVPRFRFEKEPKHLPRYVTPEHFAAIYRACSQAAKPAGLPYPPANWWRGLILFIYCGTGWRIGQALALRRDSLDLGAGMAAPTAFSTAEDTKGKRDALSALPPIVVEHLHKLAGPGELVFPWPHHRRTLDEEWADVQEAAVIKDEAGAELPLRLPCRKKHEHTRHCHVYGFHDLRRGFATMNADRLEPLELQQQMQHKTFTTTQGYINTARLLKPAVAKLYVPPREPSPPVSESGLSG